MLARALKTHANSNKYAGFSLKPTHFATNASAARPGPPESMLPFEPPALRSTTPTRPRSFASPAGTHARHEHETKPKPISRLGSAVASFPTTSDLLRWELCIAEIKGNP